MTECGVVGCHEKIWRPLDGPYCREHALSVHAAFLDTLGGRRTR